MINSTPGIRAMLQDQHIDYNELTSLTIPKKSNDEEETPEERQLSLKIKAGKQHISFTDKSCIHALFDLLLNFASNTHPTLICTHPFIGAVLHQIKSKSTKVKGQEEENRLVMEGLIMPGVVDEMKRMMEIQQDGFKIFFKQV